MTAEIFKARKCLLYCSDDSLQLTGNYFMLFSIPVVEVNE